MVTPREHIEHERRPREIVRTVPFAGIRVVVLAEALAFDELDGSVLDSARKLVVPLLLEPARDVPVDVHPAWAPPSEDAADRARRKGWLAHRDGRHGIA